MCWVGVLKCGIGCDCVMCCVVCGGGWVGACVCVSVSVGGWSTLVQVWYIQVLCLCEAHTYVCVCMYI